MEITAEKIIENFQTFFDHEGYDAKEESEKIMALIERKSAGKSLNQINNILKGHGVEAIRGEDSWDNYYGDACAVYINMG